MKRNYCEMEMNVDENLMKKVALVERNPNPDGFALVNAAAIAKKQPNDLVELAMEIQKADQFMSANISSKLQVIAQQIHYLKGQARQILRNAKKEKDLHHAACNFKKIPGNTYYLYKRPTSQLYFSMLSPQEWPNHPHQYIGGYRLETDFSWTNLEHIEERDKYNDLMSKVIAEGTENRHAMWSLEMGVLSPPSPPGTPIQMDIQ